MTLHNSAIFDGPVELVKAIFDTAAKDNKSTALNLVRVCRAARRWAIPILYETVELDNHSALRFENMLTMPSSSSVGPFVRNLRATCLPNADLLSNRCRGVRTMTLANYDIPHLSSLVLPSLTHLTIGGSLRYSHFSSSMTVLSTVTHLRFPNDVPRLPEDFMSAIPNLTHFSCCYHLSKKTQHRELEQCLGIVLAAPMLRVAVVYVHDRDPKAENSIACILGAQDPKVVVASLMDLPDETRNLSPMYDSAWTYAENRLKSKS